MAALLLRCAVALVVGGSAGYLAAAVSTGANAQRVAITATKYDFSPKAIRVRKGQPVTFVMSTPDFVHGFSIPDFNARADFVPGKTVELTLTPDKTGRFTFLCDNFCGDAHDRMSGFLVVTD